MVMGAGPLIFPLRVSVVPPATTTSGSAAVVMMSAATALSPAKFWTKVVVALVDCSVIVFEPAVGVTVKGVAPVALNSNELRTIGSSKVTA